MDYVKDCTFRFSCYTSQPATIVFNSWCRVKALVGNDRRPRETWVGSLSQTGFTGNFTVVPAGGLPGFPRNWWWTRVTLGVLRLSSRCPECSELSLLAVQKKKQSNTAMNFTVSLKDIRFLGVYCTIPEKIS
ncbi:hypothetical protein HanRHA438_Chr11g0483871 [Helianthus annuus]|nr:hypothetical protein HanRHA438_Chr11g0483871 [Helianthus annuus]